MNRELKLRKVWAWHKADQLNLPPTRRLLLDSLVFHAAHDDPEDGHDGPDAGESWPTIDLLQLETGLDVRTLRAGMKHLEKVGLLVRDRKRKGGKLHFYLQHQGWDRGCKSVPCRLCSLAPLEGAKTHLLEGAKVHPEHSYRTSQRTEILNNGHRSKKNSLPEGEEWERTDWHAEKRKYAAAAV